MYISLRYASAQREDLRKNVLKTKMYFLKFDYMLGAVIGFSSVWGPLN